ncbi:hypothetical protein ANN_02295 [Periplaneta americana]|uniref:Transposase n=1 Tax=Periplaneta americana TaxID=6978 RepID=A0ABQ8TX02_PERAM|nr:hypothetical protein ANN_02295 [Periplaneta americana]
MEAGEAKKNKDESGAVKFSDIGENSSEAEVEKFKYLGATLTNINDTQEEIKHRISMGNACYYSVEKLLSSSLLSKNLKVRIYKTVILPVVLYGCETWTLTLREEHRLRVSENKVLRKIFGAKRDEVTGEWRKLHNTELHTLYSSPDIISNIKSRRLRWAGHVARMGESRNAYRVLVGRPEGKRPLGRPRRRWEDNIKMDLREVGYGDREWINFAQDRDQWRAYVRAAMNHRKRKTSPADDRLIVRKSKLYPRLTAVNLTHELIATTGANIHVTTVRRRLLEAGRRARKPIKKQLLAPVMCKKRLMWAKLHQHWTVNDWKNVLFSDESHFEVHGHRVSYVRKGSEKVTAAHLQQAPKYPPKVMCWGCFTHEGPGALIPIKGMMNSDKYIHLLETRIVPQLQKSFPDGRCVFQQDLAPCHTFRKTTEFFNKKNIPWPGNSPENLWSICKRRMQKMDCSTKVKMISALIGEMKNICGKLVESMPNRLRAVIRNKRQIAAECHIGLATVNSIIKRYRETGSITPQKKGNCGRKRKTSPADDRLIVRKSKLNPRLTAVDLACKLMATTGANIHVTTVRRRLLEAGRRARPGALIPIKGMMNSDKYIHLLETRIVPQLQKSFLDGRGVFQQDLAPCHTSRKTTEFFNKKNIQVLPWPGNSPDINPIENLWSICKRRMQKMDCSTKEKMISALIGVWFRDEEMKNICGKLVESMPNRLRAVIRNKGGHIDY